MAVAIACVSVGGLTRALPNRRAAHSRPATLVRKACTLMPCASRRQVMPFVPCGTVRVPAGSSVALRFLSAVRLFSAGSGTIQGAIGHATGCNIVGGKRCWTG